MAEELCGAWRLAERRPPNPHSPTQYGRKAVGCLVPLGSRKREAAREFPTRSPLCRNQPLKGREACVAGTGQGARSSAALDWRNKEQRA